MKKQNCFRKIPLTYPRPTVHPGAGSPQEEREIEKSMKDMRLYRVSIFKNKIIN
jgi:hypothetical protein